LIDAREQWKEVVILITLILVRIHMLNYVDALNSVASLMSIVRRSHSEVLGKTRNGRMLVAIHTFMVLDLIAVALGRFYQLIIKMI